MPTDRFRLTITSANVDSVVAMSYIFADHARQCTQRDKKDTRNTFLYPTLTVNIDIEPPSKPSTGKETSSPST